MKKLFTLTFALLLSAMLFAQNNILLNESFDGSTLPSGWQASGTATNNWSIAASNNAGGQANELKFNCQPAFNGL